MSAEQVDPPSRDAIAPELLLGPMLRYVSTTAATIWMETSMACTVEIRGVRQRTFACAGHHYALVIIDGLAPGSYLEYDVRLDGELRWPLAGATHPPSCIRTLPEHGPVEIMFGSCRAAAPHEPPYTLELDHDRRGIGVDALRAAGLRMLGQRPEEWPELLVFTGDQVYADEISPATRERVARRRGGKAGPPEGIVADFEEYTWLYHESWSPEVERWMLSVVPSTMIFDDHDMIDDWNISSAWVDDTRKLPWWQDHIIGGLVSYWIYQHLGNLSPERIAEEGMLAAITAVDDATDYLRQWAMDSEEFTPVPGGYQFSFDRHLVDTHIVVIDSRNGRVLEPGHRQMVDDLEWAWLRDRACEPCRHVVLVTSLPLLVLGGLHGFQQASEAVCDGAWGRLAARAGEWLRRALDLEDWAAFDASFRRFEQLLIDLATPTAGRRPPATISVLAGDIHFAYAATAKLPAGSVSTVRQIVCSPLRNVLATRQRRVMRFAISGVGRRIGRRLMRMTRRDASALEWDIDHEPVFHNNIGSLAFEGDHAHLVVMTAVLDDGREHLETAIADRV